MSKQFTRILLALTVTAIAGALVAFFFAVKSAIPIPKASDPSIKIPTVDFIKKNTEPKFNVYMKDKKTLMVEWRDLPFDTVRISIYRSKDQKTWELWKDIPASTFAMSGSFEIKLGSDADVNQYYYRAEAMSGVGDTVWQSTSTPISNEPLPTSTQETAGTSTPNTPPSNGGGTGGNGGGTGGNGGSGGDQGNGGGSGTGGNGGGENPITRIIKWIFYYNPQGQLVGTTTIQNEPFWVSYADQASIEMGWQNLPPGTDSIKILRSDSQDGPWLQLLYQQGVDTSSAHSVKITDHSTSEGHYYRMEALRGSEIVGSFGPTYLPAYK